jgi:hypothetical protein
MHPRAILKCAIFLVAACNTGNGVHQQTQGPSAAKSTEYDKQEVPVKQEDAIVAAKKYAAEQGERTSGLDVSARLNGDVWEVSFYKVTPGVLGGPGFVVRVKAATGEAIGLQRYQ